MSHQEKPTPWRCLEGVKRCVLFHVTGVYVCVDSDDKVEDVFSKLARDHYEKVDEDFVNW